MRFLSLCSGIEAASVAWKPPGWECVGVSEIESFPNSALAHHYPDVPNLGDMERITDEQLEGLGAVDVLVGGTPCQSFSVAGLRGGMADSRGNLALRFLEIAGRLRPRWVVWENVPGVLSSNGGRDFGSFLGGLGELGYGFAYRVLDAQYFGVAQRRRRVFVVGCLGDWRRAAAVLLERSSLRGDSAPSRETGARVAGTLEARASTGGYDPGAHGAASGHLIAHSLRGEGFDASEDGSGRGTPLTIAPALSHCLNAGAMGRQDYETEALVVNAREDPIHAAGKSLPVGAKDTGHAVAFETRYARNGRGAPENVVPPLKAQSGQTGKGDSAPCVLAFHENQRHELTESEQAQALNKGGGKPGQGYAAVRTGMAVRRLTPRECERLQGLPDDYTLVPHNSKPAKDGPRYKALGNSFAVPVVRWLGERIEQVESL